MKIRVFAGVALATVALALPTARAASAQPASGSCHIDGYHPTSVVVGASPITTRFGISTHGCAGGLASWSLEDFSTGGFIAYSSADQNTFEPELFSNSDAGLSSVVATANDKANFAETQRTFAYSFDLKRRVAVVSGTMNASPEPVRRGGTVSIVAHVVTVDWDSYPPRYVGFAGHYMAVQFRTESGTYKTVKNVTTDSAGWVRTTATQSASGYWRVVYGGTTVFGPMAALGDHVLVS